jgi:hypothetical protein
VHEGGYERLKRRERAKAVGARAQTNDKSWSDRAKPSESWGKHHAKKKPSRTAAPVREEPQAERKMERRKERRSKDERKQKPRRR